MTFSCKIVTLTKADVPFCVTVVNKHVPKFCMRKKWTVFAC